MKDGGEAFPVHTLMHDKKTGEFLGISCNGGMTLRDYFAGQALAGILANGEYAVTKAAGRDIKKGIADTSYEMADAMLAEREKTNGKDND